MTDMHHDDENDGARLDVQRALADVRAPATLRRAVEQAVAAAPRPRRLAGLRARRVGARSHPLGRPRLAVALATGAAVLLAALAIVLGADDPEVSPRVRDVAQVALRPAAAPAPAALPGGELLAARSGPIAFPTWTSAGWRATGERTDTVGGRELRTVFYADPAGRRVGYAIADAELPFGGRPVEAYGARLWVLQRDGADVVAWHRAGRTCILASRDVPLARLVRLAGYAA
jgi:hypothetical protein